MLLQKKRQIAMQCGVDGDVSPEKVGLGQRRIQDKLTAERARTPARFSLP